MTTVGWQIKAAIVNALRRIRRGASCRLNSAQISRNIFLMGLGLALSACAGGSDVTPEAAQLGEGNQKTDELTPETFTTVGKPTKTIETPWGARDIYDPLQDAEVRAIFTKWYNENKKPYIKYREENSPEFQVIRTAALTHELDFLKNKCEMRERVYHLAESPYYKKKYTGNCDTKTSIPHLSVCVEENLIDRDLGRPEWMVQKKMKYNPNWGVPDNQKIEVGMLKNGFIIGQSSYPSVAQQMDVFFGINCRKWVGLNDVSKGHELYFINPNSSFSKALGPQEPDLKQHCEFNKEEIQLCQDF